MQPSDIVNRMAVIKHLRHLRDTPGLVGCYLLPFDLTTYNVLAFETTLDELLVQFSPLRRDATRVPESPGNFALESHLPATSEAANFLQDSGWSPFIVKEVKGEWVIRYFTLVRALDPTDPLQQDVPVVIEVNLLKAGAATGSSVKERALQILQSVVGADIRLEPRGESVYMNR